MGNQGSAQVTPDRFPDLWHTIRIAGQTSPGICWLRGFKRPYGWDKKTGKGSPVTTITFQTLPPCEGEVEFELWLPAHYVAWGSFQTLFKYDKSKPKQGFDIYHPSLADIDCKSVVCEWISALEPISRKDPTRQRRIVKLYEYQNAPQSNVTTTPNGSKPNTSATDPNKPPDPNQDLQNEIQAQRLKNVRLFNPGFVGPVL